MTIEAVHTPTAQLSGRLAELEQRLLAKDRRALARVLSWVESGDQRGREMLRALYPRSGRARTIGLTGSPGAGKSTVTNELAKAYRQRGESVGIVAIDPSSPYTMGAILGDRVRMTELYSDPDVFIRSLASRGALGGLSAATQDVVHVLDAYGKDVILIETVGAGQDEVDIAGAAQTTVLVNTPNMGDEVQTLKAGIMEIADVLAVNKSDLPGADRMVSALKALLSLNPDRGWDPPVVRVVATQGEGTEKLVRGLRRALRRVAIVWQAGVGRAGTSASADHRVGAGQSAQPATHGSGRGTAGPIGQRRRCARRRSAHRGGGLAGRIMSQSDAVQRLQIRFAAEGPLKYVSHLDLMRVWERVCKRAGLLWRHRVAFRRGPRLHSLRRWRWARPRRRRFSTFC